MLRELLEERGLGADHTTVGRWVQRYTPELESTTAPALKADQHVEAGPRHLPSGKRPVLPVLGDRFRVSVSISYCPHCATAMPPNGSFAALSDLSPAPRVINTDLAPIYGLAIADIRRKVRSAINIIEQDDRAIKRHWSPLCRAVSGSMLDDLA
jgi:hypothetical protein